MEKTICVAHHPEAPEYKHGLKNANTACMREVFAVTFHVPVVTMGVIVQFLVYLCLWNIIRY